METPSSTITCPLILLVALICSHATAQACEKPIELELDINTVFDEDDEDITWLHKLANALHVDTKPATLENELAFFSPCEVDPERLYEVERHLRSRNYLRNARVGYIDDDEKPRIKIETWDNWSLMPIADFGREGGKNHFEFGIKDRNLLGWGVDAEIAYFSDPQRSGYKLDTEFPLYIGMNINAHVRLIDSPDGYQRAVLLNKPFVSTQSQYSAQLQFNHEDRIDTLFQNDADELNFRHEINFRQIMYGWKAGQRQNYHLRMFTGLTQDKHEFSQADDGYLPLDRNFSYPWLRAELLQEQFVTLHNIHLIEQDEDLNLGWHLSASLGYNAESGEQKNALMWTVSASKGWSLADNTLLFTELNAKGQTKGNAGNATLYANLSSELIHRLSPAWALYGNLQAAVASNPYLDLPVNLGGDTGLRGLPLQYQHGDKSLLLNAEVRYYPKINVFKLFELGGAVFYDVGRTFGDSPRDNTETGLLQSIGLGARFYSTHSADRQVIHVDLVHPLSDNPELGNFEVRVEVKHAF